MSDPTEALAAARERIAATLVSLNEEGVLRIRSGSTSSAVDAILATLDGYTLASQQPHPPRGRALTAGQSPGILTGRPTMDVAMGGPLSGGRPLTPQTR